MPGKKQGMIQDPANRTCPVEKVKERLGARPLSDGSIPPAFFEVELQLDGLGVCLRPSIEEIQSAINGGAVAVLKCSKMIEAWDTVTIPRNVQLLLNPNLPPVRGSGSQGTFYDRVAQDKEILKVVLLLTGSIQTARNGKDEYLRDFERWSWLWNCDIDEEYRKFLASEPSLDEFEARLRSFARLDDEFQLIDSRRQISALSLHTGSLAKSLRDLAGRWKDRESFAKELHLQAFQRLEVLSEVIKSTMKKLSQEVADGDIEALGQVMRTLREVREKQGEIELELEPVAQMYAMLDSYLPNILDKEDGARRQKHVAEQPVFSDLSIKPPRITCHRAVMATRRSPRTAGAVLLLAVVVLREAFVVPPGDGRPLPRAALRLLPLGLVASAAPAWADKGVTKAWKTRPDGGEDEVHTGGVEWEDVKVGTGASTFGVTLGGKSGIQPVSTRLKR
eukprot:s450_g19.t1